VMANYVGCSQLTPIIFRNPNPDPLSRSWIGRCDGAISLKGLSTHKRTLIGVSGAVAECVWNDPFDWCDEVDWWERMSSSDWTVCGCEKRLPDIRTIRTFRQAHDLLYREGPLWAQLCATARKLIVNARVAPLAVDAI